jgi:RimJ/RimL family protein N-acetyltransferase
MNILETNRLLLREMDPDADAAFVYELLNSPKFLQYIGDRGVRSVDEAAVFIEDKYRQSYRDNGFGLYTVELKDDGTQIGICGFVKRNTLPGPDIGFAFLPDHERKGYGFESAAAILEYGRTKLNFDRVLAITSPGNEASENLLAKLGFIAKGSMDSPGDSVNLFEVTL